LSRPHFGLSVRVKPTLPKVGTWSPPGLPKIQSSIDAPPTPQRTQMWAQVTAEEGVGARSLAHNT
jgi:hypothetical protein